MKATIFILLIFSPFCWNYTSSKSKKSSKNILKKDLYKDNITVILEGNVGKLKSKFVLEIYKNEGSGFEYSVQGYYFYYSQPTIYYSLSGNYLQREWVMISQECSRVLSKNFIEGGAAIGLTEYTNGVKTADIQLLNCNADKITYEGKMYNTDGRIFNMNLKRIQ